MFIFPKNNSSNNVSTKKTPWYSLGIDTVYEMLDTKKEGLSEYEVLKRLEKLGQNKFEIIKEKSSIILFLQQFLSPLVLILIIAGIISWFVGNILDTIIISIIIFINSIIGFTQEWRAERSVSVLKKLVKSFAKVRRENILHKVDSVDIVVGDIVEVVVGDIVPADIRLIEDHNCSAKESILTGESEIQIKNSKIIQEVDALVGDRKNMIFMGTFIAKGKAVGVVVSTGIDTEIGSISEDLQTIKTPKTKFQKAINRLGVQLLVSSCFVGFIIFTIGLFRGIELGEMFIFTLASIISLIPEGLPASVSVVLAVGVYRMSKHDVIVRQLSSAETSGSISVICTDKTGTLTKGEMMVQKIVTLNRDIDVTGSGFTPKGVFSEGGKEINPTFIGEVDQLLKSAVLAVDASLEKKEDDSYDIIGDPTEGSILVLGEKAGIYRSNLLDELEEHIIYPFDSQLRYGANYIRNKSDKSGFLYVAGSPEKILQRSRYVYEKGNIVKVKNENKEYFKEKIEELSSKGLRLVGISFRVVKNKPTVAELSINNLVFVGICAMIDAPREDVSEAITKAKESGVRIIMVTGDYPKTGFEIAKQVGIANEKSKFITGKEVEEMNDEELSEVIDDVDVIARVTPRSKLRVVQLLQSKGAIVAMTGDGVNDAPALQQADIGIAMGITGTDVAREASRMILMKDNFSSIVNAMEEGRIILRNIRHTVAFLVSTGLSEGIVILTVLLLDKPLVWLPIQILFLNLVTGGVTDVSLAMEGKHKNTMNNKGFLNNTDILIRDMVPYGIIVITIMSSLALASFLYYLPEGIDKARTIALVMMSFCQFWNVLNTRSFSLSIFSIGLFSNKYIIYALILSIGIVIGLVHTQFGNSVFSLTPLSINEWITISIISSLVLWSGELLKIIKNFLANKR